MEHKMGENGAGWLKNRGGSDSSLEISWEHVGGQRWSKRAGSDPGVQNKGLEPDEMLKELHSEAARAREHQKMQEADLLTTPPRMWRSSGTPPMSRTPGPSCSTVQIIEEDEENQDEEQDAPGVGRLRASLTQPARSRFGSSHHHGHGAVPAMTGEFEYSPEKPGQDEASDDEEAQSREREEMMKEHELMAVNVEETGQDSEVQTVDVDTTMEPLVQIPTGHAAVAQTPTGHAALVDNAPAGSINAPAGPSAGRAPAGDQTLFEQVLQSSSISPRGSGTTGDSRPWHHSLDDDQAKCEGTSWTRNFLHLTQRARQRYQC